MVLAVIVLDLIKIKYRPSEQNSMGSAHEGFSATELENRFDEFAAEISTFLSEEEEQDWPPSTPELIGQTRSEGLWQSYLTYLIDPTESHRFDALFLDAFLQACEQEGAFDTDVVHPDRSRVKIMTEIDADTGIPDVLVYHPDRWFLLLEIKVDASEGVRQTERYANASSLGPISVNSYPSQSRYYAYLAPTVPRDIHDEFVGVHWSTIATEVAEAYRSITPSTHSVRNLSHADDFITLLETTMTDVTEETRQRAQLYFKYREEIEAADEAVEEFVKNVLQHEWSTVLTDDERAPSFWDESWSIRASGKTYAQVARQSWELPDGVNFHFEHHPDSSHFRAGELEFRLDLEVGSDRRTNDEDDPRTPVREAFVTLVDERDPELPADAVVDDGSRELESFHRLVETYYEFEPGDEEDYYEILVEALEDHASLISIVDEIVSAYPDLDSHLDKS